MKFNNGRISRDRKRSAHEIAEGIALVKAIEQKKRQRRRAITRKVAKIAAIVLILINTLLMLDLFLLGHTKYRDRIVETNTIHGWYYYTSKLDLNIVTAKGQYWTIKPTGYETVGERISYSETPLFNLQYDINAIDLRTTIERVYDAVKISRCICFVFLLLGIGFLAVKFLAGNHYFASFIILITVLQDILLIW